MGHGNEANHSPTQPSAAARMKATRSASTSAARAFQHVPDLFQSACTRGYKFSEAPLAFDPPGVEPTPPTHPPTPEELILNAVEGRTPVRRHLRSPTPPRWGIGLKRTKGMLGPHTGEDPSAPGPAYS